MLSITHLDKVQPVANEGEAELLQVLFSQEEDGTAIDVVMDKVGDELAEAEGVEPGAELLGIPR